MIEVFSVYDFGTALKEDRVSSVVQLGVDEVILILEPPWGGTQLTTPIRVASTRTAAFRKAGVSVCWGLCPPRKFSRWVSSYRHIMEDARAIAKLDAQPLRLPTALELLLPLHFSHKAPPGETFGEMAPLLSRWLTGDRDRVPVRVSNPWRSEGFPSDVAPVAKELVYDGRSSWTTGRAAWRAQVGCGMPPGGAMIVDVTEQPFMQRITSKQAKPSKPLKIEDALTSSLDGASHAGARRVALWHLGALTDSAGALNRMGVAVAKQTEIRRRL